MPSTSLFLENLRRLHRDERSLLTAFVTGAPTALGESFRAEVQSKLGIALPEDAFVAFDYQISGIYAAAAMLEEQQGVHASGGGIERGNQEHVDLLVAWEAGETVEMLIVETEGISGWSGKRLLSRALWLGEVFGYDSGSANIPYLRPHFALASPVRPPADLPTLEWPAWAVDAEGAPAWLQLPVPDDLLRVIKTDRGGRPLATGGHWLVEGVTLS
jgi:hypothetical protein